MEDSMLFDLFGSLSREIGGVRAEMKEGFNRLETSQARTEAILRRAIRLAVRDARRQRERNAEFDKRAAEFDKRHLAAEEQMQELRLMMKAFLERSGNGAH